MVSFSEKYDQQMLLGDHLIVRHLQYFIAITKLNFWSSMVSIPCCLCCFEWSSSTGSSRNIPSCCLQKNIWILFAPEPLSTFYFDVNQASLDSLYLWFNLIVLLMRNEILKAWQLFSVCSLSYSESDIW